jgi:hypothetical protein
MMGVNIANHPRGRVATYRAYRIDDTGRLPRQQQCSRLLTMRQRSREPVL